jgi:hypothetical protein
MKLLTCTQPKSPSASTLIARRRKSKPGRVRICIVFKPVNSAPATTPQVNN